MAIFLLTLNIILAVISIFFQCLNKKGIEINHIILFGFGFLFYWMLPVIIGENNLLYEFPMMDMWHGIYDNISKTNLIIYLIFSLFFQGAFYGGHIIGKRVFAKIKNEGSRYLFDRKLLVIITLGIIPLIIYYISKFRSNFFGFYGNDINTTHSKGQFISLSLIILSLAFLYCFTLEKKLNLSFVNIIYNPITLLYFVIALLILTMGGRLYIFSSIIMFLVYYSVHFKPIKRKTMIISFAVLMILMGFIGVFRLGKSNIALGDIFFNVVAEPIYTDFSLISFLGAGRLEMINIPIFLIKDFLNLIPTFILPDKANILMEPQAYGYYFVSPLGAMSSFVSFIINFGMLGSINAIFLFSFMLTYIKRKKNNRILKLVYIMVSGWIPFAFFRDPFSVSIVKQMFEFSFIVPLIIMFTVIFISSISSISRIRLNKKTLND